MHDETPDDDARSQFRDALEKKRKRSTASAGGGPSSDLKFRESQRSGGAARRFQRKSGSA